MGKMDSYEKICLTQHCELLFLAVDLAIDLNKLVEKASMSKPVEHI